MNNKKVYLLDVSNIKNVEEFKKYFEHFLLYIEKYGYNHRNNKTEFYIDLYKDDCLKLLQYCKYDGDSITYWSESCLCGAIDYLTCKGYDCSVVSYIDLFCINTRINSIIKKIYSGC